MFPTLLARVSGKAVLLAAAAFLIGGCAGVQNAVSEFKRGDQASRTYFQGYERYMARDFEGAVPLFGKALQMDPNLDDARAYLAWSYYYLGKYPEATLEFKRAIPRRPDWQGLYAGLGWSRYRVARYHLALQSFQDALRIEPQFHDAKVGLGFTLFELRRYDEAAPALESALLSAPGRLEDSRPYDKGPIRAKLAWSLYYRGRYGEAREQFERGIREHPDWWGLYGGLGWTLLQLGDRPAARRAFEKALGLQPQYTDAREGMKALAAR